MEKGWDKFVKLVSGVATWVLAVVAVVIAVALVASILALRSCDRPHVEVDDSIGVTPTQVRQIEAMGQMEFLGVADEVMVDTTKTSLFSRGSLSKIYRGELHFGVDLSKAQKGWIQNAGGDSLHLTLPPIELLDSNFIDEAATTTFFEKGKWTAADREALYQRARSAMLRRNCTQQNLAEARRQAEATMREMFRAMGYSRVGIEWANR